MDRRKRDRESRISDNLKYLDETIPAHISEQLPSYLTHSVTVTVARSQVLRPFVDVEGRIPWPNIEGEDEKCALEAWCRFSAQFSSSKHVSITDFMGGWNIWGV